MADEPVTIFYEVDAAGRVPQMVELFADGRRSCAAVEDFVGRENELAGVDSLVDGVFFDHAEMMRECEPATGDAKTVNLVPSDADAFEREWRAGCGQG